MLRIYRSGKTRYTHDKLNLQSDRKPLIGKGKSQMSKRILILDDERDSNKAVEMVLQDNGFRVDSYEDPILALENFKSYFYDLTLKRLY